MRSWSDSAEHLRRLGMLDESTLDSIRWLELFSRLIANTDVHGGNLSFFTRGTTLLGLAPAYDVGPSYYMPRHGHLDASAFEPPVPTPADGHSWNEASSAAMDFWSRVESHRVISTDFREHARANRKRIDDWRLLAKRLPA